MARYDKYNPVSGGFRAQLAAAVTAISGPGGTSQIGIPIAMGLNGLGQAVVGAGVTGQVGCYIADQPKAVGDIADVMTEGEIVDLNEVIYDPGVVYHAAADGSLTSVAPIAGVNATRIGFTVGDRSVTTGVVRSRLIVRVIRVQG